MKRKAVAVAVAIAMAVAGTAVLVAFVQGAEDRALEGEQTVEVLVVEDRIAAGTPVDEIADRVTTELIPDKVLVDNAVADLEELAGLVAAIDLLPGEQITTTRFVDADAYTSDFVAADFSVPDDLLQITVALSPERALGGAIQPGDSVAVFASFDPFGLQVPVLPDGSQPVVELDGYLVGADGETPNTTHIILHKVLVTNVQLDDPSASDNNDDDDSDDAATGPADAPGGDLLVTLAIDAPSAERIIFAAEHGRVWLALDPPGAPTDGTKVWTRGSIYAIDGSNELFAEVVGP